MAKPHYSGTGNAALDGCGMMALIGLGILLLGIGGRQQQYDHHHDHLVGRRDGQ